MGTFWHADHIYRHEPAVIASFLLTVMAALNLFRAFVLLNLKPCFRARHSLLWFAQQIKAGVFAEGPSP
jgi:hypothetical protein